MTADVVNPYASSRPCDMFKAIFSWTKFYPEVANTAAANLLKNIRIPYLTCLDLEYL